MRRFFAVLLAVVGLAVFQPSGVGATPADAEVEAVGFDVADVAVSQAEALPGVQGVCRAGRRGGRGRGRGRGRLAGVRRPRAGSGSAYSSKMGRRRLRNAGVGQVP